MSVTKQDSYFNNNSTRNRVRIYQNQSGSGR